jgi:DNA (cytosine-5)-methyltransferase 1
MIKAVDLFCGIGGLTRGLLNANINVVAGVDLDNTCKYAYTTNNLTHDGNQVDFINESVSDLKPEVIQEYFKGADYTLLAGCAPCQPFSRHQKDKTNRKQHSKWGLLYDFAAKINRTSPDIVSMENVPSLINEDVFLDFIEALEELNYHINWQIVNAADYGVPQRRRRLLLLASKLGEIKLIEPTQKNNHITVKEAIGHLDSIISGQKNQNDPLHTSSKLRAINIDRIKASKPGGSWKDWPVELRPTCYTKESGKTYTSVYGRMSWDDVSPTLTTQFPMYGTGRFGHPEQNRAISLREGSLLQSFPEDYQFYSGDSFIRTHISRQIGNAVPVKLGEAIGISIQNHIQKIKNEEN